MRTRWLLILKTSIFAANFENNFFEFEFEFLKFSLVLVFVHNNTVDIYM